MIGPDDAIPSDSAHEDLLERVLAEYIAARENGRVPDRRQILEEHPEIADDLQMFFAQADRLNRLAEPIRGFADDLFRAVGPGRQISYVGNYELLEEIARGGMGVVYKARQTTLGRIVAVKMIVSGRLASGDDVKRFQVEARAAAGLQHPNIVSIHEVGQHEGWHYFSMDYVEGRALSSVLRDNPLPPQKAATYVRQMAQAIHYAHDQGTLHRDLKPSNVLIDNHDQVRVTDFGLAMRIEGDSNLTQTGQIMGTPSYMPPEQALGKRSLIGPGTDVYSLGAILYECLAGRAPFRADTVLKTIDQVVHVEAASPRLLNPGVPRDLETICLKCLQKEPHRRYGTAQLLADDLGRYLRGEPITARPAKPWERGLKWIRRRPTAAALVLASLTAMLLLVGVLVGQHYNARLETVNGQLSTAKINLETINSRLTSSNDKLAEASVKLQAALEDAHREKSRANRYLYVSQMTLAERARKEGQIGRVIQLLRSVIPETPGQDDFRGFEWHHLWRLYHGETLRLRGHTEAVAAVAFSPDDRFVASGSVDRTVKIWNAVTGVEVRTLEGHTARITCIAYSPDGSLLISGDTEANLIIWNTATGNQLHVMKGHEGPITSIAFSTDGTRIVSGSADRTARIWSSNTFQTTVEFKQHTRPVRGVAFSPDGRFVASVSNGVVNASPIRGEVLIWNADTGETTSTLDVERPALNKPYWTCVSFSPDGKSLAAGGLVPSSSRATTTVTIEFWNIATGHEISSLSGHGAAIQQLNFSPDSTRLVSGSLDHTIKVWDLVNYKEILSYQEESACLCAVVSHDGSRIVSGSEDTTIKLWNMPGRDGRTFFDGKIRLNNVAFSPDGTRIAAEQRDFVFLWDVQTGSELVRWKAPSPNGRLVWSSDGRRIAIGGGIWDSTTGARIDMAQDELAIQTNVWGAGTAFSPDNNLLAAVASSSHVAVWDVGSRRRSHLFQTSSDPGSIALCLAFSGDGKQLAIGSGVNRFPHPGTLQIWDLATAKKSRMLEGFQDGVVTVTYSPDGKLLAAGIGDVNGFNYDNPGEVRIWETETWRQIYNFRGHRHCVFGLAFSPDGRRLASVSGRFRKKQKTDPLQGEVKLWDLETGLEVAELHVPATPVFGVAFSPCGRFLATSSDDGTLRIYDGTPVTGSLSGAAEKRLVSQASQTSHQGRR